MDMEELPRTGLGEKGRLISTIAVLLVAGFVGTSLFAFFAARDSIRLSIEKNSLPTASEYVYSTLQKELLEPIFVSSMMASDTFLHDWIARGEGDLGAVLQYLSEIQSRYGVFAAFIVSESTRRYYEPKGILKIVSRNDSRDAWYFRVSAMAEPYEINLDPDMAHGDAMTVFINYRVIDSSGKYLGAAGVGISVATMNSIVDSLRLDRDTAAYFVDQSGNILIGAPYGVEPTPSVHDDPALSAVAKAAISSGGGSYRYNRNGSERLLHVKKLPEIGWFLFVERTEDTVLTSTSRALWLNLAVFALIVLIITLITAMTIDRYQSRLERTASYDPLTGAFNRLSFGVLCDHAVKDARRSGAALSIVMLDIDDFKRVNDELGHPAGDKVLGLVVAGGQSGLRQSDPVCRWGGEEFIALLADCDIAGAVAAAEKFRSSASALCQNEGRGRITLSAGVATLRLEENFYSLVNRADKALLSAKRNGKDRTESAEL